MVGADGRAVGMDCRTVGADGLTVEADGRAVGMDCRTVGADGLTVEADGRTVGMDCRTVGADGRTDGMDGSVARCHVIPAVKGSEGSRTGPGAAGGAVQGLLARPVTGAALPAGRDPNGAKCCRRTPLPTTWAK